MDSPTNHSSLPSDLLAATDAKAAKAANTT